MISEITGLEALTALESLDLSDNYIEKVSGLSGLPVLRTLTLSGNKMRSIADVQHLEGCPALTSLDLSNCRLEDTAVVDMVIKKPLSYLRLQGNPCVSSYRYRLVAALQLLTAHFGTLGTCNDGQVYMFFSTGTTVRPLSQPCPASTTWMTCPCSPRTGATHVPSLREALKLSAGVHSEDAMDGRCSMHKACR
jgi:Leucine-rich repeat (LRR) protein